MSPRLLLLLLSLAALACCCASAAGVARGGPAPLRRTDPYATIEWRLVTSEAGDAESSSLTLHTYTTGAHGTHSSQLHPFAASVTVAEALRSGSWVDELLLDKRGPAVAATDMRCEV